MRVNVGVLRLVAALHSMVDMLCTDGFKASLQFLALRAVVSSNLTS